MRKRKREEVLLIYIAPMLGGIGMGLMVSGFFDPIWPCLTIGLLQWYAFLRLGKYLLTRKLKREIRQLQQLAKPAADGASDHV